jgi:GntR family transcriptional regulator
MTSSPGGSSAEAAEALLEAGGMPLHRQLFLVLKDQISRGALVPGQALPAEQALGEQFGVSRITVRRALQDLSGQGYVVRRRGRGTFVRERPPAPPPPPARTFQDSLRKAQLETTVEVIEVAPRTPPPAIAAELALRGGDALYVLRLRRDKTTGEPLILTESWLPPRYADVVTRQTLTARALFQILADAGAATGRVVQELTAEIAGPRTARLLDVSIGAPVIRVNRLIYDTSRKPSHHLSLFLSPDRSRIIMDIPADDIDTAGSGFIAHDVPRTPSPPSMPSAPDGVAEADDRVRLRLCRRVSCRETAGDAARSRHANVAPPGPSRRERPLPSATAGWTSTRN